MVEVTYIYSKNKVVYLKGFYSQTFHIVRNNIIFNNINDVKKMFPKAVMLVEVGSTHQPKALKALKEAGAIFYFSEKIYLNQLKDIITEEYRLFDLSGVVIPAYIKSVQNTNVEGFLAENKESIVKYAETNVTQEIIIHLSISDSIVDNGITLEELPEVLELAKEKNLKV